LETRIRTRKILSPRCVHGLPQYAAVLLRLSQIDEGFAEDDLEANLQRDKYARLTSAVNELIDELTPSAPDFQLRDACDQLVSPSPRSTLPPC
jgi:aminoglycoside/choline kinase family phosphotransferase